MSCGQGFGRLMQQRRGLGCAQGESERSPRSVSKRGKQRVGIGGMSGGRRGGPRLETREILVASDKGLFKSGNTN